MCTFTQRAKEKEDFNAFSFYDLLLFENVMHLSVVWREKWMQNEVEGRTDKRGGGVNT